VWFHISTLKTPKPSFLEILFFTTNSFRIAAKNNSFRIY
jgi:hypothetical protein